MIFLYNLFCHFLFKLIIKLKNIKGEEKTKNIIYCMINFGCHRHFHPNKQYIGNSLAHDVPKL